MKRAYSRGEISISEIPLVTDATRAGGVIGETDGGRRPAFDGRRMCKCRIHTSVDDDIIREGKCFYATLIIRHLECNSEGATVRVNIHRVLLGGCIAISEIPLPAHIRVADTGCGQVTELYWFRETAVGAVPGKIDGGWFINRYIGGSNQYVRAT